VERFFQTNRPAHVLVAAARVGGIWANNAYPAQFIYENLAIQCNLIHAAWKFGVRRLLFLGSSCIYPRDCPQPIREAYLLTGPLEATNEPYAIAKIAGIKMCQSYNRQYGTRFYSVMPTNLYGPNDNFDLETSHVLPALIRKFHEAKLRSAAAVEVWGTGRPHREFLHVDDLADACLHLMRLPSDALTDFFTETGHAFVNIGCGKDLTIEALAHTVKDVVGFNGEIVFDVTKPDGTPQKLLDVSGMARLGWAPAIGLEEGLRNTYQWCLDSGVFEDDR
jgi:GDP-L-fucose synthase